MNYLFRKKPVVIEAFQMTQARRINNEDWPNWLNEAWQKEVNETNAVTNQIKGSSDGPLQITTLEGVMKVNWNDFIIKGVKDELYACKPEIFDTTYEVA